MAEQPEIALVVDDATWQIWRDNKQWLNASSMQKDAAWRYWRENYVRLVVEIDYKAEARKYYHENKDRINEQRKKRYQEHKEEELEKRKQYYENNKDKINEARRQNQSRLEWQRRCHEHKDEINEARRAKVMCECGGIHAKSYKARHLRSTKHCEWVSLQNEKQNDYKYK